MCEGWFASLWPVCLESSLGEEGWPLQAPVSPASVRPVCRWEVGIRGRVSQGLFSPIFSFLSWAVSVAATLISPVASAISCLNKATSSLYRALGCAGAKGCTCKGRGHKFDPWVGKMPWRRTWKPTSVFLPGEFHGQRSPAGYSQEDLKELDTTEAT